LKQRGDHPGVEIGFSPAAGTPANAREETVKSELVEIAYRLIAQNGLEGFRIRQSSRLEAGIDNGTLHYHFPEQRGTDPRGGRLFDGGSKK